MLITDPEITSEFQTIFEKMDRSIKKPVAELKKIVSHSKKCSYDIRSIPLAVHYSGKVFIDKGTNIQAIVSRLPEINS